MDDQPLCLSKFGQVILIQTTGSPNGSPNGFSKRYKLGVRVAAKRSANVARSQ